MESYRNRVSKAAETGRTGLSEVVPNFDEAHASILMEFLFGEAQVSMAILTGHLNDAVYGEPQVVNAAVSFLKERQGQLRILVEDPARLAGNRMLDELKQQTLMSGVEVRSVPAQLKAKYTFHLAVADDRAYRIEANRANCAATGRFGDELNGRQLAQRFNELWSVSAKVVI